MKNWFFSSLMSVALGMAFSPSTAQALCLQNFNAYGPLYAGDLVGRTHAWTAELRDSDGSCDLVQLQEVWTPKHIDMVAEALGASYQVLAPNRERRVGVMALTRGEVLSQELVVFKVNNLGGVLDSVRDMAGVEKGFQITKLRAPSLSFPILALNLHLHPTSARVRSLQLLEVLRWRLKNQNDVLVLSGDFNMGVDSLERSLILAALGAKDAVAEVHGGSYPRGFCTYCEENHRAWMRGHHVLDYVLISNGPSELGLEAVAAEINLKGHRTYTYSDHYGLRVELRPVQTREADQTELEERRRTLSALFGRVVEDLKKDGRKYAAQISELRAYQVGLESRSGAFWDYFRRLR